MKKQKIYHGDVCITKENSKEWEYKLKDVVKITGDIIADQGASITIPSPVLAQTGDIIADQGASITIPSPVLAQTGDIRAYQGASITIPSPVLAQTGYIRADQGASITIPSPVLAQTGYIIADQGASITIPSPVLAQTGDIDINSDRCEKLAKYLIKKFKTKTWYIRENTPDYIVKKNFKNAFYYLNGVRFKREWYIKIKNDTLTPDEVFAIDNIEHRRIAYQFMDKTKMKSLKDFTILDQVFDDNKGYAMQVVSFTVQNMSEPLKFLNCFCPSTGREYYLGTNEVKCWHAKNSSFGFGNEMIDWVNEW